MPSATALAPPGRARFRFAAAAIVALTALGAPLREARATPRAVASPSPVHHPATPPAPPPGTTFVQDEDEDDVAGIALVATGSTFVVGGAVLAGLGAVVEGQDDPFEPTDATPWWIGAGASAVVGASMLVVGVVLLADGDQGDVTARIAPTRADLVVRF